MIYRFRAFIYTESCRAFIKIPFNVWEETGLKGNIPCRVSVLGFSFECKLIPKGSGNYLIPITKKTMLTLEVGEEYEIEMEPIETLSRINHDSPYSKGDPYQLPLCCIVNNDNSFLLWYKGSFYGTTDVDPKKTISYIEIFVA